MTFCQRIGYSQDYYYILVLFANTAIIISISPLLLKQEMRVDKFIVIYYVSATHIIKAPYVRNNAYEIALFAAEPVM